MTKNITPLKIGFVLDDGLDKPDGVQQNILTLGEWFKQQGHAVVYIVGETKRTDISSIICLSKNIRVNFNGNSLTIPLFSSANKIKSVIKTEKFDVLHVQVPYSPLMAARLVKRLDNTTVVVGTFHIMPNGLASSIGSKLLGMMLKSNLKKFDKQLAVSEPARKFAAQSFKINCEVLPNPVDISKYRATSSKRNDKSIRLLFLGRLVPRKGCYGLLEAINYMLANHPPKNSFHLDICGDGPLKEQLVNYVENNQLDKYVKFHGFISEEQKIKFMQKADMSIFPSLGGESFGLVLVEAMAAGGGIVLGGDNSGYRSVLGALTESLINPKEVKIFSKKLKDFIDSENLRDSLFIKQQKLVQQFDVNVVGTKLLNIYKDCISDKKST